VLALIYSIIFLNGEILILYGSISQQLVKTTNPK